MSSNRLMYDSCAYKAYLNQNLGPYDYMMYPGKYENCGRCRVELGTVGGNGVSLYKGNMVDLESDLRGQTRPLTDCPSQKFMPKCPNCKCAQGLPCGCVHCQQKLAHQPTCQLWSYKPVVPAHFNNQPRCHYNSYR